MTTNDQSKSVTQDVSDRILNQVDAILNKWNRRGYCPCCIARHLLMHAGLFAAHEVHPDDMRKALGYIATLNEKYGPPPDPPPPGTVRH
jgi:hypothetical protein